MLEQSDFTPLQPISVGVEQVSSLTGWSRTQTYQFIKEGRLTPIKLGRRRLVKLTAIEKLLDELEERQAQ